MSAPRVAFLFGSGISYPSNGPTVGEISKHLFEQKWTRHTKGAFLPSDRIADAAGAAEGWRTQEFLRYLKGELDGHLRGREERDSNYEDLYAAALQIFNDQAGEITNPLIARSIEMLRLATAPLYVSSDSSSFNDPFTTLVGRALDLIQGAVANKLAETGKPNGLDVLTAVAGAFPEVDIFTLNHDQLVERQFAASDIKIADGFGDLRQGYRIFNGYWPDGPGVRLLKLHGSLNWYFCRFKRFDQYAAFDQPMEKCYDEDGTRVDDLNPLPAFLSGTTVKEQRYGYDIFGGMFFRFRQLSSQHQRIISCGYGWGDKGINVRIDQWLHDQRENRLIILHGGDLAAIRSRRFWWRRWEPYLDDGKVVVVRNWLGGCSLADICGILA